MTAINQKEYLKKYLSIGTEPGTKKKKKKKKAKAIGDRIKIIDDDIDSSANFEIPEEELFATNEDAPQIVGVIDERPLSVRVSDYRRSDVWKPLGSVDDSSTSQQNISKPSELNIKIKSKNSNDDNKKSKKDYTRADRRRDLSPRRKRDVSNSPRRRDGNSPPRRHRKSEDFSPKRRDNDASPPRKSKREDDISPPRKRRSPSVDLSPRRKRNDLSPPRRIKREDDISPPRKRRSPSVDLSPRSKRNDLSPPRRIKREDDISPARKRRSPSIDISPQRKRNDLSPPRRNRKARDSPPRKRNNQLKFPSRKHNRNNDDTSPPRKRNKDDSKDSRNAHSSKITKTLDGKTAGLQNATELAKETQKFREREDAMFKNISADVSGANAATVIRCRKTGKIRDLEQEAKEEQAKQAKESENKEKYSRWGKGLKQVDDIQEKIAQDLHEMSKPLARYADDEDLERYLKEQEREGDPMLAYIRKKKKKVAVESGKPLKPQYEGEFMPNRFGIRPGYRWDGVDRSNGYEKKWFQVQNAKHAQQEEVYKWSTEDM